MYQLLFIAFTLTSNLTFSQVLLKDISDNNNNYVFQASDSTIWISSLNAVNRYDGTSTKIYWPEPSSIYGLKEGLVQSNFIEDEYQNIWFTTVNYLTKWNKSIDGFESYQIDDTSASYRLIDIKNGLAYLQVGKAIYSFDCINEEFEEIYNGFQGIEFHLEVDEHNDIKVLYGTRWNYGKGILKLYKSNEGKYIVDTLTKEHETRQIRNIKDKIYFGTDEGLFSLEHDTSKIIVSPPIYSINVSADNNLMYSDRNKVYEIINSDSIKVLFNSTTDRIFNPSKKLFISSKVDEGVTITNNKESVFHFEKSKFIAYRIAAIDSIIFFSFKNGDILKIDDGQSEVILNAIYDPIFTKNNTYPLTVLSNYSYQSIIENNIENNDKVEGLTRIRSAVRIDSLHLIIIDKNSIFVWNEKTRIKRNIYNGEIYEEVFLDSKNNLYISDLKHICIFKIEKGDIKLMSQIPYTVGLTQYLPVNDSIILLGSSEGIKSLNKNTLTISDYKYKEHYIQTLLYDNKGDLWFGTRNALYCETKEGKLLMYNEQSGLPTHTFSKDCSLVGQDGTLYFGTNKGVLYFHPDSIKPINYNPNVMMTSLKIHGHEWMNDTINIETTPALELDYNKNTLTFDFVAVDYSEYNHPQYNVYLDGYDVDTTLLGDQSVITYPNLPAGEYTFKYGVCTISGYCKQKYSTLQVTVHPPYWKTWWFRSLLALLGLSILGGSIILYLRNKLKEQQHVFERQELLFKNEIQLQQERNRIADELHDELGGKLSSIKFASKKVQRADSIAEVKSITSRVSELSTELIESMRSIIWAMDTQNDTYESFTSYIRAYTATLAVDNDLNIKCTFESHEISKTVKGQVRHHLSLAIKEILHNVIKHAEARNVAVNVGITENQIVVSITEDGKGYNLTDIKNPGKGLRSIQKRMTAISGTVQYTSSNETITLFIVPLV